MNAIVIDEITGLDLIERYIFEKRGVKIKAKRPRTIFEIQLYDQFVWIAYEYFEAKK